MEITVNKNGVNANIKAHLLNEEIMRKIGFTDCSKVTWYFERMIQFSKDGKYKNFEISFSVSINKENPEDFRIDVLDDDFCQPYDYQYMLEREPSFEPCLIVKKQVEEHMEYLQNQGVLSGHVVGEYI